MGAARVRCVARPIASRQVGENVREACRFPEERRESRAIVAARPIAPSTRNPHEVSGIIRKRQHADGLSFCHPSIVAGGGFVDRSIPARPAPVAAK